MPLFLFNPWIWPYQVLPRRATVDLGAMAIKGYSAFLKAPASLEPRHQIVQCHIQDTRRGEGLTPLQRRSQCILQPQPTGQDTRWVVESNPSAEMQSVYSSQLGSGYQELILKFTQFSLLD